MKKILSAPLLILLISALPTFSQAQCKASFSVVNDTTTCAVSLSRTFYDSSFILTINDQIIKEIWNYGDGVSDTITSNFSTNKSHTFIKDGFFSVKLTIFTQAGCYITYSKNVSVYLKPKADFIYTQDTVCSTPATAYFTATSQMLTPHLTTPYTWTIDNGASLTGVTPSYAFTTEGLHAVILVARTRYGGCKDTITKFVAIAGKPKANFNYQPEKIGSKTINFNDATSQSYIPLSEYFWDFGDGTTSTEINPSHTYNSFDSFLVTHYSKSIFGCMSDTIELKVYVDSIAFIPSGYQSNSGNEFWTGFGYQEKMIRRSGDATEAKLSLYIAAGSTPTRVTISLPNINGAIGFPKTINIPADSVVEVTGFPTGDAANNMNPSGLPDTRLYYTGISNRSIHITSNSPVSVWEHIYTTGNSAGMSLLLPTIVLGSDYFVQSIGGKTNNANANSFFFVVATEDSTILEFTPKNNIVDSSMATIFTENHNTANIKYHAGETYQLLLNKGQIFNAMGFISGTGSSAQAQDLSGTHIISKNPLKKIAVFGGNGRLLINTIGCNNTAGSDNLIQQMFPKSVWGTMYLTTPTKMMEYGIYRITVSDTTTIVKINGNTLPASSLINGSYYQIENNKPNLIESDKKIMLTQYIITPGCPGYIAGNNGLGDPEMITLSSTKYPINNVTIFAPLFKNGLQGGCFVNVIIKKEGVSSFRLDKSAFADTGQSSFIAGAQYGASGLIPIENAFKPHPGNNNYSYARLKIGQNSAHTLESDSSFTAIVYGTADAESFGFNAGFNFYAPHLIYRFIGTGNWSDASNWEDNLKPPSLLPNGSEIFVIGNATLNVQQTLEDGAILIVQTGGNLTVNGNLILRQ